jgi:hypothetical protein
MDGAYIMHESEGECTEDFGVKTSLKNTTACSLDKEKKERKHSQNYVWKLCGKHPFSALSSIFDI